MVKFVPLATFLATSATAAAATTAAVTLAALETNDCSHLTPQPAQRRNPTQK